MHIFAEINNGKVGNFRHQIMKKAFRVMGLAAADLLIAVSLASCSGKTEDKGSSEDSVSTDPAEQAVMVESATEVSSFASTDLATYNLRGKVMSVEGTFQNPDDADENGFLNYTISFDKDGKLLIDNQRNFNSKTSKEERDAQGRLIMIHHEPDEEFGAETTYTFGYENGRLSVEGNEWMGELFGTSESTYFYDVEGNEVKTVCKGNSDEIEFTYTSTFAIKEKDEKGNWTKRIIHNVDVEKAPDMDEQTGEIVEGKPATTKYDRIEVRKIKYYE